MSYQDIKIGHIQKQLQQLKFDLSEEPKEIMISDNTYNIDGTVQPPNGTVYMSSMANTVINLPSASEFTKLNKIIILAIGNEKIINIININNNIRNNVIYSSTKYSSGNFKLIQNGFVELLHTSNGWYVTASYGFIRNI